jgi:hypothetical protein
MFKKNFSSNVGTRCLVDALGGCSAGIRRLYKKIECWKIPHVSSKIKIFRHPIFLPSPPNQIQWPPNVSTRHLVPTCEDKFFSNIIGSQSRVNKNLGKKRRSFLNNQMFI